MWGRLRGDATNRAARSQSFGNVGITLRGPAEHTVLDFTGELDFSTPDRLAAHVLGLPHNVVAFDLSGLEFVDADGVLLLQELAADRGQVSGIDEPCTMLGMPTSVERVFDLVERSQLSLT